MKPDGTKRRRGRLWLLALAVALGAGLTVWLNVSRAPTPAEAKAEAGPPFTPARHLNAGPNARFIGSEACAACHKANHASYLLTAHSQALSDLDPKVEPPDGSFQHGPSGRSYRVHRENGQFRHEEVVRTADGKEVARMDLPVRYLIGSGHFCRSYLVEVDGFLHESPITWYTSKKKWDLSPGYDFANHSSFERRISQRCLSCHAGRVEPAADSLRLTLHEKAIGCESCHGAGSLHAERHRPAPQPIGDEDLTIVNPGKLPRPLMEAVCASCHLNGAASVPVRGRQPGEFRPGQPLTDFRTDYRFDSGSDEMTVVGHIEQLRNSRCYQKSDQLSCLTCHDPHAKERPKDPIAFQRQKCLDCHAGKGCTVQEPERRQKAPGDNCAACHMPRGDTDIPHVAFTHHRIGKHGPRKALATAGVPSLKPIEDAPLLPPADRQRNLGLAYLSLTHEGQHGKNAPVYLERARSLLEPLAAGGQADGAAQQALAQIYLLGKQPARASLLAAKALERKDLTPDDRAALLVVRADCLIQEGRTEAAIAVLEELVKMRRFAEDWRVLGRLRLEHNENALAIECLQQALAIRPYRAEIHGALAEAYRRRGDAVKWQEHLDKAKWLSQNRQQ